jgi:hypothetical protein
MRGRRAVAGTMRGTGVAAAVSPFASPTTQANVAGTPDLEMTPCPAELQSRAAQPDELVGEWLVRRIDGLLLPIGLRKTIGQGRGWTRLWRLPIAAFRVRGQTLYYLGIPIEDRLTPLGDGTWSGRGYVLGRQFCRFRLLPVT